MTSKEKRIRTEDFIASATDEPTTSKSLPEVSSSCRTSIMSISDKELLSVFSLLPLCDLQCLELVSHYFRWIALKVYSDRRSLSLIQSPQYRTQLEDITRYWHFTDYSTHFLFGDDCYRVTREVSSSAIRWFGERFPNVTKLTLYCVDHLSLDRFVQLIQLYPTLERLILFSTATQQTEYNQPQFWTALYSLQDSLHHLHLPFEFTTAQLSRLMTPTLRSFYHKIARSNLKSDEMFAGNGQYNLVQYGLLVQSGSFQFFLLMKLVSRLPAAAAAAAPNQAVEAGFELSLPGMYMTLEPHWTPAMSLEATNFKLHNYFRGERMAHLDLAFPSNIGLLSILPTLSQLTHLTHIRLTDRKSVQQQSFFFSKLSKQNYRIKLGQPNRTQFTSVRQLNISQFAITPSTGILLYLPIIFPQVHTLCLEDCPLITNSTGKIRVNSFPIWLLNSIQRFGQLHQLYHNQRLVLQMDRDKDGDKAERDRLVQVIVQEVIDKERNGRIKIT